MKSPIGGRRRVHAIVVAVVLFSLPTGFFACEASATEVPDAPPPVSPPGTILPPPPLVSPGPPPSPVVPPPPPLVPPGPPQPSSAKKTTPPASTKATPSPPPFVPSGATLKLGKNNFLSCALRQSSTAGLRVKIITNKANIGLPKGTKIVLSVLPVRSSQSNVQVRKETVTLLRSLAPRATYLVKDRLGVGTVYRSCIAEFAN